MIKSIKGGRIDPPTKKVCGMCEYCRSDPETKTVFCARNPPQIVPVMQKNPISNQAQLAFISMLPNVLEDIVCGEFKAAIGTLCTH